MKPFIFLLLFMSGPRALTALADGEPSGLGRTKDNSIPNCEDDSFHGDDDEESANATGIKCAILDAFSSEDGVSSTGLPGVPFPKLLTIGYGGQWKKGIQHWVAFPMLGLVACKESVDLGRMSVGPKHGACQKSFKIANKWYQLNGCNPTTGMPEFLLDGNGVTIASCAAKKFQVLCLKEGKIWGRGSCEGPPPDEPGSLGEWENDTGEHI